MKLYLMNAENIYFPQIKEYYREIVSSYDNGNYRSAMVMLYSTIVCDLLLKLKELSDVYNDKKAEKILKDINEERKKKGNSAWEWDLIETIRERTELLSDESYAMIEHIYDLRNFSAHPAMNDDYELISPSPEMTVAYCLSFASGQLCEGRMLLMVFDDVIVEQIAIVAGHLQCGVSHDLLKGERIASAVHQILTSEGVSERMDRSPLHTSAVVVLHDGEPQGVLSQETTELITEQVIRRFALSDCHVIP